MQYNMSYHEAREYLKSISARGDRLGLESVRRLADALGNPQDQLKFIHIAGTNGKGSVMAFLEETLTRCGYKVGRYTSPAVFYYEERYRINGRSISRAELASLTGRIRSALEQLQEQGPELAQPTLFEAETVMAFSWFAGHHCDLVLLETGMGGETDATNIVGTSLLEIFSSISMDHMEFLGHTLGEIAAVKAGIIKEGTAVVSDDQEDEAAEVLRQAAAAKHAAFRMTDKRLISQVVYGLRQQQFSYKSHRNIRICLSGTYQIRNAATALEAVDVLRSLGWHIPEDKVEEGFAAARWPGRFEIISSKPLIVLDGAHNADAARVLKESVGTYFPDKKITLIFGVFSDKEYGKIIETMAPLADRIYTVETRNNPRALPAALLAEKTALINPHTKCIGSVEEAMRLVLEEAQPQRVYLFFGSLSWLQEAKHAWEKGKKKKEDSHVTVKTALSESGEDRRADRQSVPGTDAQL